MALIIPDATFHGGIPNDISETFNASKRVRLRDGTK